MRYALLIPLIVIPALGCVHYQVVVKKREPAFFDGTSISPILKQKEYKRVMVIPPSGTARGAFENQLAYIEGEFLKRGLTIFSPAVTARIVLESQEGGGTPQLGTELSDVERALILAKKSNAEAVLQIGTLERLPRSSVRYFVSKNNENDLVEVDSDEIDNTAHKVKFTVNAPLMEFTGRLIDVDNGEVVASFRMKGHVSRLVPKPYVVKFAFNGIRNVILEYNYEWDGGWMVEAEGEILEKMFSTVAGYVQDGD